MTELDFESKKLKEVQQQYLELIKDCQPPCNKLHGLYQVLEAHLMSKLIPLF